MLNHKSFLLKTIKQSLNPYFKQPIDVFTQKANQIIIITKEYDFGLHLKKICIFLSSKYKKP